MCVSVCVCTCMCVCVCGGGIVRGLLVISYPSGGEINTCSVHVYILLSGNHESRHKLPTINHTPDIEHKDLFSKLSSVAMQPMATLQPEPQCCLA